MPRTEVGQAFDIIFVWSSELKRCSPKKERPCSLEEGARLRLGEVKI